MKIILCALAVVILASSGAFASGAFASGVRTSTLNKFEVSSDWKDLLGLVRGNIQVDEVNKVILLRLSHSDDPAGDVLFSLPLVESRLNGNVRTFKGLMDHFASDGPRITVLVEEAPLSMQVHISLTEEAPWTTKVYQARFEAGVLK